MPMVPNAAILTACALRAGGFFHATSRAFGRSGRPRRLYLTVGSSRARVVQRRRTGPLCGKRVQRRLLFLLAKSEAVFCRAYAAPGRMVGFRRRIEERSLRRGCNG